MNHPLVAEFLAFLAREGTPWAEAKSDAFARIVEAFAGDGGLPDEVGLRQIEKGQFDARLSGAWKPAFLEAYRQWLGFLLDHRVRLRPRPLTLSWWLAPLALIPRRLPAGLAALGSPLVLSAVVLGATACLLGPGAFRCRLEAQSLARTVERARASLEGTLAAEESAASRLRVREAADLHAWLGERVLIAGLHSRMDADRALLEERLDRAARTAAAGPLSLGDP